MSLTEAMDDGLQVSKLEAIAEYRKHGLDGRDLFADLGERPEYQASDVLIALGY